MRTTKAHFKIFKEECQEWIEAFGLKDWFVDFYHEDWSEHHGDAKAWCRWNVEGMIASVCLSLEWGNEKPIDETVKMSAFHEICHLLIGRLFDLATDRYIQKIEIDVEAHAIIRRLENAFMRQLE